MWPAVPTTTDRPTVLFAIRRQRLSTPRGALLLAGPLLALPRPEVPLGLRLCLGAARAALLRLPHARQDVGEAEIDHPALHVHLDHLHADAIPEPVDAAVVLAAQDVLPL